jgi:serine/threonine-protein kinase HipA
MIGYVYRSGVLAATLRREGAHTLFEYEPNYLAHGGLAVASTLPLSDVPVQSPGGSVAAFFSGLLPEGRRLSALVRQAKTSADDELSLLLEVGGDTVGDVYVTKEPAPSFETTRVILPRDTSQLDFSELQSSRGIALNPRLAGVQDKASAHMISYHASRGNTPYIIKFDPPEFPHLCRNEFFFLSLARKLKIPVARSQLASDTHGNTALLVNRFDREDSRMIHLEDGAQALNRYPADKYNLSFEEVAQGLSSLTMAPVASRINLLTQLGFAWLTGNGDLHAKNLSVLGVPGQGLIAPMYDLPSSVFYSDLDPELAMSVGGSSVVTSRRFMEAGQALGLPVKSVDRVRLAVLKVTRDLAAQVEAGALPFDAKVNAKASRQLQRRWADLSRES